MRQIKFRGKRLDNGEWVVGDLLHIAGGCLIYFGSDSETAEPDLEKSSLIAVEFFKDEIAVVDPDTVGQYTSYDDCQGAPMFEGDVVKIKESVEATVEWSGGGFHFYGLEDVNGRRPDYLPSLQNRMRVIASIHDKPSQLESQPHLN